MDGVPFPIFNTVGILGLLSLTFFMIASGRLVTRREHERMVDMLREAVSEWRSVAHATREQVDKLIADEQMEHALLASLIAEAEDRRIDLRQVVKDRERQQRRQGLSGERPP